MTWTIDESRVRPFLTAAERHDVPALLWNALKPGRAFPGTDLKRQISFTLPVRLPAAGGA
ncbi:hypothetical protein ACF07Y_30715 [Streptomyces sp. NPDC016566]|uniref:hypothetical protein n=1 Tax=unclassified Streptomyces TaxID=2593676 RepID=UPI0036EB1C7F